MQAQLITTTPVPTPPPSYKLVISFDSKREARILRSLMGGLGFNEAQAAVLYSSDRVAFSTADYDHLVTGFAVALAAVRE